MAKSISANSLYQSQFLPIFEEAGARIKVLILSAFLTLQPKYVLIYSIMSIIQKVNKQIPQDIVDRQVYLNGLYTTSMKWVKLYYDKPKVRFLIEKQRIEEIVPSDKKLPKIDTPAKLNNFVKENKVKLNIWSEAKGTPYITNYDKEVEKRIKEISEKVLETNESGKKSISLWQKAELDVRHEHQMKALNDLRDEGVEYAFISSHPNCSKRCECWQGELFSLNERALSPQTKVDKKFHYDKKSFLVGKVDNHNVYSLTDIMNVVDEYGYNNNIIVGFNCRHRLLAYTGQHKPTEYDEEDIKKQREIEKKIRAIERKIRSLKQQYELLIKDYQLTKNKDIKIQAQEIKSQIDKMTDYYIRFCEENGYAYEKYRIKIR